MSIYLPIAQISVDVFLLLGLGGITGILSGLFGIGGGFLMTPLLIFIGVSPAIAVSSVANQMIAASISGFYSHWRKQNVDFRMGLLLLCGGFIGSSFGVWLFDYLKNLGQIDIVISISYVLLLSLIGGIMAFESGRTIMRNKHQTMAKPAKTSRIKLPLVMNFPRSNLQISAIIPISIGIFIGGLVSMLGLGGGFFMIPAMLYIIKMPASLVVGTSLFQMIFISANVTLLQAINTQTVDIVLACFLLIGSSIGAQVGIRLASRLPTEYARSILAAIVLAVALQLALKLTLTPNDLYEMMIIRN